MATGFSQRRLQQTVPVFLFALNLLIAWRLLTQEYTNHHESIEPFFYAIAASIKSNWLHPGWFPQWNCGMPFRYTYQPLLHYMVAGVSEVTAWSTARAFHFTLAILYAAGPVSLYFLARRLSGRFRIAFAAALLYSLCSPSTWLIPDMAVDTGGLCHARRLHSAVVYGDGPHVSALTLVPLALLLIDRASSRRSVLNLFAAALGIVAVPLMNIPAALVLGMAVLAYLFVSDRAQLLPRVGTIAACSVAGYLLVAPLMPPSALLLTARNTQWMDPQAQMSSTKLLWLGAGLLTVPPVSFALRRLRVSSFLHFSVLFFLITAAIVLGKAWGGISLIAQPTRFHLAMEMAICMTMAGIAGWIAPRKRWAVGLASVLIAAAVCWQIGEYRLYARKIVKREPIVDLSEYKIARWMDAHAAGNRVWVPGSVSFWLNALTATPQMTGCCDQNLLFQAPRVATYEMGTDDGAGTDAARISTVWMQALGVKYVALSGPRSTEHYRVTHHPAKFDSVLPKLWQDGDDAIFEIPGPAGSLAHWIAGSEAVARMPENGIDIAPLLPYTRAIADAARPRAQISRFNSSGARIHGTPRPGELLSVQIPYHFGWRAETSAGSSLAVGQDALGFLLLKPNCQGDCSVDLIFDGGLENKILLVVSAMAWSAAGVFLIRTWSMQHNRRDASGRV